MSVESYVDVLIIGAGPAGLMCANALVAAGIDVRIIDKRSTKVSKGQADGVQPRSIEVLQSYGLAERLIREGNQMHGSTFYNSNANGEIECTNRLFDSAAAPTARYPFQVTLNQGSIEAIFLDSMQDLGIEVERSRQPSAIEISGADDELSNSSSHPVKVTLERLDATDGEDKSEIVHAKYVLGSDGAHSWIRKSLGVKMEGEKTDFVWGVIDMIPETNFPDIRLLTHIRSMNGTCLLIPREGDVIRLYIHLSDKDVTDPLTGKIDVSKITPETLLSVSSKMFHPFELKAKEIVWWTVYIIGQRVASSYSSKDRVFIAGDACHTHSSNTGQGMNASFNDSHNLAWKLAHVLKGWASPSLLKTYEYERRKFAQDLINYDKKVATRTSKKPELQTEEEKASHPHFMQTFRSFVTGVGIHYSPSAIVYTKHQTCAPNLIVGKRMLPQILVRAADWCPVEIQDMLPADVRFKVLFFVGSLTGERITELDKLAEALENPSSFLCRYSTNGNISTVFDIITIATDKKGTSHLIVPPFFRPHWTRSLLDDMDGTRSKGGDAYKRFGIDAKQITLVVVRPDGYVGAIAPSTALEDLNAYFGSFMIPCGSDDK